MEAALSPNAEEVLLHRGDVVAETEPLAPRAFLAALLTLQIAEGVTKQ